MDTSATPPAPAAMPVPDIPGVRHRTVRANGVRLHVAEAGEPGNPTVLLLHGFPEGWYSWRHQLVSLAAAGYHVLAPDQRGYGRTDTPADVAAYSILHLVGDAVAVLDAAGARRAVVVGHDWGAPVAWHTALLRPDRVRGVVGLSVPFLERGARPPLPALARRYGGSFYQLYFQLPGVADAELAADPRASLRRLFAATSGGQVPRTFSLAPGQGFLDLCPEPAALPGWLTEADLDVYTAEFVRSGFTGGLNWYRNIARNWELTAPWHGARVETPALYLAGTDDLVLAGSTPEALTAALRAGVADLHDARLLPGCGHWTQQERPDEVDAALLGFLDCLDLRQRLPRGSHPATAGIS